MEKFTQYLVWVCVHKILMTSHKGPGNIPGCDSAARTPSREKEAKWAARRRWRIIAVSSDGYHSQFRVKNVKKPLPLKWISIFVFVLVVGRAHLLPLIGARTPHACRIFVPKSSPRLAENSYGRFRRRSRRRSCTMERASEGGRSSQSFPAVALRHASTPRPAAAAGVREATRTYFIEGSTCTARGCGHGRADSEEAARRIPSTSSYSLPGKCWHIPVFRILNLYWGGERCDFSPPKRPARPEGES